MESDANSYWNDKFQQKLASLGDDRSLTPSPTPESKTLGIQKPTTAAPQNPYKGEPWMDTNVIAPLVAHENPRGITNDDSGDKGKAWGILQQHDIFAKEANNVLTKWRRGNSGNAETDKRYKEYSDRFKEYEPKFKHEDSNDPKKAIDMYRIVLQDRFNQFKQKFGREPNATEMASMHHRTSIDGIKEDKEYTDAYNKKRQEFLSGNVTPSTMIRNQTDKPFTYQDLIEEITARNKKKKK